MITEVFYSQILNMNRGSCHTRSFRGIHLSVLKVALQARKVPGAFEKRAPGREHDYVVFLGKTLLS